MARKQGRQGTNTAAERSFRDILHASPDTRTVCVSHTNRTDESARLTPKVRQLRKPFNLSVQCVMLVGGETCKQVSLLTFTRCDDQASRISHYKKHEACMACKGEREVSATPAWVNTSMGE